MQKKYLVLILIFLISCKSNNAFGATIELVNGRIVNVEIIEETPQYVRVIFSGEKVIFYLDEIKEILREEKNLKVESLKENPAVVVPFEGHVEELSEKNNFKQVIDNDDTKRRIEIYLTKIKNIDNGLNEYMDTYLSSVNSSQSTLDKTVELNIIMDAIRYVDDVKKKIEQIDNPLETESLKLKILEYYEQIIIYQTTILKKKANPANEGDIGIAKDSYKKLIQLEHDFDQEWKSLERTFQLDDMQEKIQEAGNGMENVSEGDVSTKGKQYVSQISSETFVDYEEYKILVAQTKELIKVNEQLKKDLELMIHENKSIQDTLKFILMQKIDAMTLEQKQGFVQYLKSL